MICRRVGCFGDMTDSNVEKIGVFSRRIILVCPCCRLCHDPETGMEARSRWVPTLILVWGTVSANYVPEDTIELKPLTTHHSDDDREWFLWKDLIGA